MIVGHSEYWSKEARQNFDRYIDEGNHGIVLSGNTMWWQIRYEENGKKIVCYKYDNVDPIGDPLLETIWWNENQLDYPITSSIGADFDNGGYAHYQDNGWDG